MTTSLDPARSSTASAGDDLGRGPRLLSNRVALGAVALVVVHLGFRAWASYTSWFTGDDFAFIAHMANGGTSLTNALEPHGGHLMPAGMYLSWLSDTLSSYSWWINASVLLVLQLVADVGMVVCLVRMFGWRPGILPPMVLAMFTVLSVPMAVWWAVGINQLPLLISLFWGLASLVTHLRTRRPGPLAVSVVWVVAGLLFYEKTLLVIGAFAIVTLSYFATGSLGHRIGHTIRTYRAAVATYAVVGVAYVAAYSLYALNFDPGDAGSSAADRVVPNMLLNTYLPGVLGGPLHWHLVEGAALPGPGNWEVLVWAVATGVVVREIHRTRTRCARAWLLPGFFLLADVVLVLAGRASLVGPQIALELRYQGELGAVTALALACATLPMIGALETVSPRPENLAASQLTENPRRVAALTAVVAGLGLVSSVTYIGHWQDNMPGRDYFQSLLPDLETAKPPTAVVDGPVPTYVMWPLSYPDNLLSHLLRGYRDRAHFVDVATDHLDVVDGDGQVVPAKVPHTRDGLPGPHPGCGYVVEDGAATTVPLDGPLSYGGWWVRVGYLSSGTSPVVVGAGATSYSTVVKPGVHALFFRAGDDRFDSVSISGLAKGVTLCTDDVIVGKPAPVDTPEGS